jgi:hypothetical protein
MKNKNLTFITAAALAAGTLISGNPLAAEDLAQTKARQQMSVTQGLGTSSLTVLLRRSTASQSAVSAALLSKLHPASVVESSNTAGKLRTAGEQWSLEVSSDGSAAEYRNLAVEAKAHSLARPLTEKMSATELEQRARAFVASHLASQIVLGKGEQLVALRADYRAEGGEDLATGKVTSSVVASRLVFGRMINGVPVVGNGSKVYVTFTNDGSLESFRYDWPAYQVGAAQAVVGPGELLSRVQKVMGIRNGDTVTSVMTVPRAGAAAFPLTLATNTQLQSLECGYYDSGTPGKSNSVQPGCTYLAVSHDINGMRAGFAGAVPAGSSFEADNSWMETQILTAQ